MTWRAWFPIDLDPAGAVRTIPGRRVTALLPFEGHVDLFATTADGVVMSTFFEADGGWRPWFPVRPDAPAMASGARVTALMPFDGHVDLFATTADGVVMSTFFEADGGWRPWFPIDRDAANQRVTVAPGAAVTALLPFEGHVDIFATAADGTVMSNFFADGAWRGWFPIDRDAANQRVTVAPGAAVTALLPFDGHVDLFAIAADGTVMSTFFADGSWQGWFPIRPGVAMAANSEVTALLAFDGHVDLFTTAAGGVVMSTFFEADGGWRPWFPVGPDAPAMAPGEPVAALLPFDGHVDLFATTADGTVMSTFFADGAWQRWFPIDRDDAGGRVGMASGAAVTAVLPFEGHVDLFATNNDGTVMSTWWRRENTVRLHFKVLTEPSISRQQMLTAMTTLYATVGLDVVLGSVELLANLPLLTDLDVGREWKPWFPIDLDAAQGLPVRTVPGAPITASLPFDGHVDLFATTADGVVMSTFFEADGGWRPWFPVGPDAPAMASGARVTALLPFEGHVDLFATTADGVVMSTFFEADGGWRPWFPVRPDAPAMASGARVTALMPFDGHVDLFATTADGVVMSTFFEADGGWRPWFPIDRDAANQRVTVAPGAAVTALLPFEGHVDIFATAADGTVMSNFFADGAWRGWFPIDRDAANQRVTVAPGAAVTALLPFDGHVDLFAIAADGTVMSTFFADGSWQGWFPIRPGVAMAANSEVTALLAFDGHVDLFTTAANGSVMSTYYEGAPLAWRPWFTVRPETTMQAGARVTALLPFDGHVDLFTTQADGSVWSTWLDGRPYCRMGRTTAEQDQLFANRKDADENDIVVYFVRSTVPVLNGCAGHPDGKPSVAVASVASLWTLAHEIGHVLGLGHVSSTDRLMTGGSTGNITNAPPDLTQSEAMTMLASPFSQ